MLALISIRSILASSLQFHVEPPAMNQRGYSAFLAMLRQSRVAVGMTQADVAQRLGVQQSYVSKVESGARRMDVVELFAWLEAIDRDWITFMPALGHTLQQQGIQNFPEG